MTIVPTIHDVSQYLVTVTIIGVVVFPFEKSGGPLWGGMVAKNDMGLYFSIQISQIFRYPTPRWGDG